MPIPYTGTVGRGILAFLLLAAPAWSQQEKRTPAPAAVQQEQEPPEEDESLKPKEYSFNPLEADKDLKVGNFYFKKGNYKAAANRFREATRWNPKFAEAFRRLAEAEEKLKDKAAAQEAYAKYVELAPDAKDAQAIRKKLAGKR